MAGTGKRESLIRAADSLFHRNGFERSSIADVAAAAAVPLGNVYYYFKTRDELVKSVSDRRLASVRARRSEWDALASPRDRLIAYVKSWENLTDELTAHGCPVGSLCLEANKQGGSVARDASSVFRDSLEWLGTQFRAMGLPVRQARANAAQLLSGRQGSVLLSNTFKDPEYIRLEIARLKKWLGDMPAGNERK
jgi:TetR/AcrR family transcriptional repressor of nem operon